MKKIIAFFTTIFALTITSTVQVYAQCPVCTVAVIAGLGLSKYLGIDDTISGVWIGGIILSSSFWFANWLEKKYHLKTKFKYLDLAIIIPTYLLVFIPLQVMGITGHPFNRLLEMDKLVLGTLVGSLVFLFAGWADRKVRKIKGKQLFNFQKVVFPVSMLLISSLVFFFITSVRIGLK